MNESTNQRAVRSCAQTDDRKQTDAPEQIADDRGYQLQEAIDAWAKARWEYDVVEMGTHDEMGFVQRDLDLAEENLHVAESKLRALSTNLEGKST